MSDGEAEEEDSCLPRRLRELLQDSQPDATVLRDLVHELGSAAGAGEVHLVWDWRAAPDCREGGLPEAAWKLRDWQGPCLWAYSTTVLCQGAIEDQFQRFIQASSSYSDHSELSFRSMFHYTDLPSILSGDSILFLDPHRCFLPETGLITQPWYRLHFIEPPSAANLLGGLELLVPHMRLPLGFSRERPFEGTLVRLPFRNSATLQRADLVSHFVMNRELSQVVKQQFAHEARTWLKPNGSVREVKMSTVSGDEGGFFMELDWEVVRSPTGRRSFGVSGLSFCHSKLVHACNSSMPAFEARNSATPTNSCTFTPSNGNRSPNLAGG